MGVGVDYGQCAFSAISAPYVFHHYGLVIDIAEPPRTMDYSHGMVTGRANQGEGAIHLLAQDQVGCEHGAACSDPMGLGDYPADIRNADMRPEDIGVGCDPGTELFDARDIHQAFLNDLVARVEEPLFAFRMVRSYGPVEGWKKMSPTLGLHCAIVYNSSFD